MHGRLPVAPAPSVRPGFIVAGHPGIQVGLQLLDAGVDALAEGELVELLQRGLVEAFANPAAANGFAVSAGLRALALMRLWSMSSAANAVRFGDTAK